MGQRGKQRRKQEKASKQNSSKEKVVRSYVDSPLIPDFSKKGADFGDDLLRQMGLPPMTEEQRKQFEQYDTTK